MLVDGLKLTEGSSADNLSIASGFEFPTTASVGELFLKLGVGLFFYSGTDWTQLSTLDADGKLVLTQVPSLAINNTTVVGSEAAMLALTAQVGDMAVRTDLGKSFVLADTPSSSISNWIEIIAGAASIPYDISVFVAGKPAASSSALRMVAARPFKMVGESRASAGTEASAVAPFVFKKNGVDIGTLTFAAGANQATTVSLDGKTFAVGDVLTIVCPGVQDTNLSDVAFAVPAVQL